VRPDDQPRPDLDAAIDAVVPALTEVSHEAVTDSLRRTRVALSDARGAAGAFGWRWRAAAAAALTIGLMTVALWRDAPTPPPGAAAVETGRPTPAPIAPLPVTAPRVAATARPPMAPAPLRPSSPAARVGSPRPQPAPVAPSGVALGAVPPRIADLIRVVQQIPEDAWSASRARVERPVEVPEVSVAALDMPRVGTLPADEFTPGEP
jgi:hypothetical protein